MKRGLAILVAHSSSGTRMLGDMMASHPKIKFKFEPEVEVDKMIAYLRSILEQSEAAEICTIVDLKYPFFPDVIGLVEEKKIPVIHLIRRDSREVAATRFLKQQVSGDLVEQTRFVRNWVQEMTERITGLAEGGVPCYTVTYEQITSGGKDTKRMPEELSKGILGFLGLPPAPLITKLQKEHGGVVEKMKIAAVEGGKEVIIPIEGDVKVKIPAIGGVVEKMAGVGGAILTKKDGKEVTIPVRAGKTLRLNTKGEEHGEVPDGK